jgi:hypothetical protein
MLALLPAQGSLLTLPKTPAWKRKRRTTLPPPDH